MPGKLSEMLLEKICWEACGCGCWRSCKRWFIGGPISMDIVNSLSSFRSLVWEKNHISEEMSWTEHRSSIFLGHVVPESWLFLPSTLPSTPSKFNLYTVISFETCYLSWEILDFWRQNHAKLSFLWNSRAPKQCFVAWNLGLIWLVKISWPSTFICLKCEIPPFPAVRK